MVDTYVQLALEGTSYVIRLATTPDVDIGWATIPKTAYIMWKDTIAKSNACAIPAPLYGND